MKLAFFRVWALITAVLVSGISVAAAQSAEHGRKYKPMPPTAHIVVTVEKGFNSKPLTIAKKKLSYLTPAGKFRQFRITADQVDSIAVQGLSLLPPE